MKANSEGRRQNEECRSGEKLGSGIRAQPLGCRGLRQLWRNRARRQIVESAVTVRREPRRAGFEFRRPRQTVYGGWLRNLVEREGVIKFLTVRNLISPGDCRNAAVHAATFSHFRHIEPSSGWVGCRRGVEAAPCLGCLRTGGRLPTGPAWRQPAAPPMHRPAAQAIGSKLARTKLDLGRGRWMRGGSERMNGQAKDLSDRNTFFICDTDERGLRLEENLRLSSLILAYLRLMGEKCLRRRQWFQFATRSRCFYAAPERPEQFEVQIYMAGSLFKTMHRSARRITGLVLMAAVAVAAVAQNEENGEQALAPPRFSVPGGIQTNEVVLRLSAEASS